MDTEQSKTKELLEAVRQFRRKTNNLKGLTWFSHGEYMLLLAIYRHSRYPLGDGEYGARLGKLVEDMKVSKPMVSKLSNALEKKGYLKRIPDPEDHRGIYLFLTPEGKQMLEKEHRAFQQAADCIVSRMGEEDIDTLIRLLYKLSDIVDTIQIEEE